MSHFTPQIECLIIRDLQLYETHFVRLQDGCVSVTAGFARIYKAFKELGFFIFT